MGKTRSKSKVPARARIAAVLEREIRRDYRAGARLPAESRLADRFGVSTLTVREALARLAESGLIERHHGRGTFVIDPAASRHIAILTDLDISAPGCSGFWMPVVQHLRAQFEAIGYRVRLYMGHVRPGDELPQPDPSADFAAAVRDDRLLGLVGLANPETGRWLDKLEARHVPVVGDGNYSHRVTVGYADMVRQGLARLARSGCQRVAVLDWGVNHDSLLDAFAATGLAYDPLLVRGCSHPSTRGAGYHEFLDLWAATDTPPDGLVICDELLFATASYAVLERGIAVPEQLRIVTHANDGASLFSPLPAMRLLCSPKQVAETMGSTLIRLLRGDHVASGTVRLPLEWDDGS